MTRGWLVKAWLKLICTMQPAVGLLPVLMLTVPEVSDPLIEADPPLPSALALMSRLGDGPVKLMWFGITRVALPLKIKRVAVISEAVMAPLKVEAPETLRSRMVVDPCTAALLATCRVLVCASPKLAVPEIVRFGA